MRDRVVCLVRRTEPGSTNTARARLAVACGFCAEVSVDADAALSQVLTLPAVSTYLAGRRAVVSARQLANIAAVLERLRCTAAGIPYRAGNTPDPQARSRRQHNKQRVTPTPANADLIDRVCRAAPVLACIVEESLTNRRLETIQPHMPAVDLSEHLDVLRGTSAEESPLQVWHRDGGPARVRMTATEGDDL